MLIVEVVPGTGVVDCGGDGCGDGNDEGDSHMEKEGAQLTMSGACEANGNGMSAPHWRTCWKMHQELRLMEMPSGRRRNQPQMLRTLR